ncbi:MAG: HAMP domain-containing protein [Gemmatimonadetes bacterium]|nr:HAMP domain-containing protein [Gemmatimonadota bacterium]
MAPWAALVLVAAWTARPSAWWLAGAAVALAVAAARPPRTLAARLGTALLVGAVVLGFGAHQRLERLSTDWAGYWEARETSVSGELGEVLDRLLGDGEAAALSLAAGAADPAAVRSLLERTGFSAAAVYDPGGRLVVWSGTHRGPVPAAARLGASAYVYGHRPLFSHLYFTAPLPDGGGSAVVAALLHTDLPESLEARPGDFASRVRRVTGERVRISPADRAAGEAVWDLNWDGRILFSVAVEEPSPPERRARVGDRWTGLVGFVALAAWLLLALGCRAQRASAAPAVTSLFVLALLLPLGRMFGASEPFSAGAFLLPGPVDVTLGRLLAAALVGALALALPRGGGGRKAPPWIAALPVAVGFPLLVTLLRRGPAPEFLAGPDGRWVLYQLTLTLALALVAAAGLRTVAPVPNRRPELPMAAAGALVALLAVAGAASAAWTARLPAALAALWGFPAGLAAVSVARTTRWRRALLVWAAAVILATGAALPYAWSGRIEARMAEAERQLGRLGHRADPYLDFLLARFSDVADSLHASGSDPVEVLYGAWSEGGLAEEGYPVWLTVWSPNNLPAEELRVGAGGVRPAVADDFLDVARERGEAMVRRFDLPDVHYLGVVPLTDGSVVTAVVPPLKELRFASPLGPLFGGGEGEEAERLTLVPLLPGDPVVAGEELRWERSERGWQVESSLTYPEARYHAHYEVDLSAPLLLAARGGLLLAFNLALLIVVWGLGRALVGGSGLPWAEWRSLAGSFRARVTLALFGFFLLPVAIFGTLTHRTIAGAAERTARVLAERVASDAANVYLDVGGQMGLLSRRVGADLLEYRNGALREASVEELAEIGLYEGWVPYDVYRALDAREALQATTVSRLGRWEYVTAYRRLADGDILGTPVPLQAGATAVRSQEVAHLLAFAVVLGGALSLALALLVGRALARPIQTLMVASERVGSGNLSVRLPAGRMDEFGSVFEAFNRMVARLRRARRDLVRTTRRTEAIVEDAATGVIAFDPAGRVTLVNPMAAGLLGLDLQVGEVLEDGGGGAGEVVRWVERYFKDALREAGAEFQLGERRVRVRARRISREGPLGGAVMSLEDVTDELRTERILAWGQMARQVAHEVKNPLTPIKLSVQHIRRAWEDRRPDFDAILTRNADAMLREIDRLATIASSFSRFGAPRAAGQAPLEPVRLHDVVEELLTLYSTGDGAIAFERHVPEDLPPARARETEVKEVLVNLLENARAAIPEQGTVRVEAWPEGALLVLAVLDDGTGIAADLLPRVFEPHFSTRSTGTGLGLAIVRKLVESWDGTVSVESRPGRGTTVQVHLRPWRGESGSPPADEASGTVQDDPGGTGSDPAV